jgi:hypothetical protein
VGVVELATAGGDVNTPAEADGGGNAGGEQAVTKGEDSLVGGAAPGGVGGGVEGDEVDMAEQTVQKGGQLSGVFVLVVEVVHQGIFKGDPAVGAPRGAV